MKETMNGIGMNNSNMISNVFKIVLSLLLMVVCFFRSKLFPSTSKSVNAILTIVAAGVCVYSILTIYRSIYKIMEDYDEAKQIKLEQTIGKDDGTLYSVDTLTNLIEQSDIIDIVIYSNGKLHHIGASSESRPGVSNLYNKQYYIDSTNLEFDALIRQLDTLSNPEKKIAVILIDDIPQ